jgi:hypothetical protein
MKDLVEGLRGISAWVAENPDLAKWAIFGTAGAALTGAAIVGLGAVVTSIGSISAALAGLGAFLAANPVVLTILGIAAAGAAGYAIGNYLGLDDVGKKLGAFVYDLVQWFKGLPDRIKKSIGDLSAQFVKVGEQIVQGIINGVKSKAAALWAETKALGRGALNSIKEALDIRSPSRQFYLVGEMAGEGMRVGILAKVKDVSAAAKILGDEAVYGVKEKLGAEWLKRTLNDEASLRALPDANEGLFKEGEALTLQFRTELERTFDDLEQYDRLLKSGAITWDTYGRAVAAAHSAMTAVGDNSQAAGSRLSQRNADIAKKYAAGVGIRDLSAEFGLSEEWIGKIVARTNEAEGAFTQLRKAAENAFRGMEDVFVNFVQTGKLDFKGLVNSIIGDLARMAIRQTITAPLSSMFSGLLGSIFANANGGVYKSAGLSKYSGQIVDSPTVFPFAKGVGLMGEAGPEAILPLKRGSDGRLGVAGGGGSGVTVNIIESPGGKDAGSVNQRRGADGENIIDVVVEQIRGALSREITRGEGLAVPLERRYGLNAAAGAWR